MNNWGTLHVADARCDVFMTQMNNSPTIGGGSAICQLFMCPRAPRTHFLFRRCLVDRAAETGDERTFSASGRRCR